MKIIRYMDAEGSVYHAAQSPDGTARRIQGDIFGEYRVTDERADVRKLLAPVAPVAFLCIGLNYRQHAAETKAKIPSFPVLFMKSPGALQHPNEPILLPTHLKSGEVDYEGELAVIIGKLCKNVSRADAFRHVLGYTCANDVSARDWQKQFGGSQWTRGKTFDTFAPLGPSLVTPDEIPNPNSLHIRTVLNDAVMQDGNTSDMIFDVPTLIEFLSGSTTLLPGTAILTGTPQGVGLAQARRYCDRGNRGNWSVDESRAGGTLTDSRTRADNRLLGAYWICGLITRESIAVNAVHSSRYMASSS
jgi:2-keto-4-pentenoate hydratase/2-oxohepta-3-ene-1,7-dioic acid hydratase in catechol pathway